MLQRILTALLIVGTVALAAPAARADVSTKSWRYEHCRYERTDGRKGFSYNEVRKTIECAVRHWSVPGGFSKAVAVAQCESGLRPDAYNPSDPNGSRGVYQILRSTWSGWFPAFRSRHPAFGARNNPFSARSNVLVAIEHAHRNGWGAWSCRWAG